MIKSTMFSSWFSSCLNSIFTLLIIVLGSSIFISDVFAQESPVKKAYFGELHIHSGWSFDSYFHKVRATPEDAYRYNTGQAIGHFSETKVQASQSIDFMALTDHAEYMGFMPLFSDSKHPLSKTSFAEKITSPEFDVELKAFLQMTGTKADTVLPNIPTKLSKETLTSVWQQYVDLADKYYKPGEFTTLIGFEWSAIPNGQNLHRNVIFRGNKVPKTPFSSIDSINAEDLWSWLDQARKSGSEVLAIPHNSNISNGLMFDSKQWSGKELDEAYSAQRMRNEPLVEITQIKGTSDTHPLLSPEDEWANFEILDTLIGHHDAKSKLQGSYVRQAYKDGIQLQKSSNFNPFKFGLIGASDGHNSTSPVEENNYTGKLGRLDADAEARRGGNPLHPVNAKYSASGLTGVWATENTREGIFDALQRKETFATTGTRLKVRFFGGWNLTNELLIEAQWSKNIYDYSVPMGGTLSNQEKSLAPSFIVQAIKDPSSAWLDRVQIIKGWTENGKSLEQVYDVACSDGNTPDPKSHRCPSNGALVDIKSCDYSKDVGDTEFLTVWQDPEFDADEQAFYYVRVLENPTCRWSTWDANRNGWKLQENIPATIQERAWSSPIWYQPK